MFDVSLLQNSADMRPLFCRGREGRPSSSGEQRDGFHPTAAGYLRLADLFWTDMQARHAVPAT
jgi:hypothetical protein